MHTPIAPARRGSALILSVLAVVIVSLLSAGFLQVALSISRRLSSATDTAQAMNLAEAGLCEAYTGLAMARTGNVGSPEAPAFFGGGMVWVEATTHESGLVELEATGLYGTGRATLGIACEPMRASVSSLGVFALQNLRPGTGVRLDSYDSSKGSYAEQVNTDLNDHALVGSNRDVAIATGDIVMGDVVYGPTGKVQVHQGSVVTGSTSSRPELEELPEVDVPAITMGPAVSHASATPLIVPPGEAGFTSLEVGANASLVLQGPLTAVFGSLVLQKGAQMTVDTHDGPVALYVTKTLDLGPGSSVATPAQKPGDLAVFVAAPEGTSAKLRATSAFHGFVYAPHATLVVGESYEVFGGLVANALTLDSLAKVHFDLALGASLESMLPLMHGWRVVELPEGAGPKRMDPFQVLGLDPNALRTPADAHADQALDVRYVAADGTTHSYSGLESGFDWSLVSELVYGLRDGVAFYLPGEGSRPTPSTSPLLALVSSSLSSKDLRDALMASAPVPSDVLQAICARVPPMSKSDLSSVLRANEPLDPNVLLAAITSGALDSSTLKGLLIDSSPLLPAVLSAVLARIPPLSLSDLLGVLAAQ